MILCAELVSSLKESESYQELAAAWLLATRCELFSDFDQKLRTGPASRRPKSGDFSSAWGDPESIWASLRVQHKPSYAGGRFALYSERAWRRMLDGLAENQPFHITVEIRLLDDAGLPVGRGLPVELGVDREHDNPEWTRFRVQAPSDLVAWTGSAEIQQRWADFVYRWAIRLGACYGSVAEDTTFDTELERATGQYPWNTVPRCREVLRGYPWVTVCARELAARLGGAEALVATGAFHEVRELPNGSMWLQATATMEEYRGPTVQRVFEALAPVLLPGKVEQPEGGPPWPHLVMGVDAADYQ